MEIKLIGRSLVVLAAAAALMGGCGGKDDGNGGAGPTSAPTGAASSKPGDNGVAALEASAIVDKAKTALKGAKSFRVKGTINADGQKTTIDYKIHGKDVVGSMTVGKPKVQVLRVGGKQYIKPDAAFWKLTAGKNADAVIRAVGSKWVLVPASNKEFGSVFAVADVDQLLAPSSSVTKGSAKQIGGTPAIGVVDKGTDGGTLYVATTGQPYPLRLDGPTAADGGLTFSNFNASFADLKAPAASDVRDLSKVHG